MRAMTSKAAAEVVLMSAWLGAAIIVAAAVAPAAFAVLPSRTLAGALVGRVLPVVFFSGLAVGLVGAAMRLGAKSTAGIKVYIPSIAIVISCAVAQLVIAPRIDRIRSAITGPVEALSLNDPRREAFGQLHGLSVMLLGVAMLSAIAGVCMLLLGRDHSVS